MEIKWQHVALTFLVCACFQNFAQETTLAGLFDQKLSSESTSCIEEIALIVFLYCLLLGGLFLLLVNPSNRFQPKMHTCMLAASSERTLVRAAAAFQAKAVTVEPVQ